MMVSSKGKAGSNDDQLQEFIILSKGILSDCLKISFWFNIDVALIGICIQSHERSEVYPGNSKATDSKQKKAVDIILTISRKR